MIPHRIAYTAWTESVCDLRSASEWSGHERQIYLFFSSSSSTASSSTNAHKSRQWRYFNWTRTLYFVRHFSSQLIQLIRFDLQKTVNISKRLWMRISLSMNNADRIWNLYWTTEIIWKKDESWYSSLCCSVRLEYTKNRKDKVRLWFLLFSTSYHFGHVWCVPMSSETVLIPLRWTVVYLHRTLMAIQIKSIENVEFYYLAKSWLRF